MSSASTVSSSSSTLREAPNLPQQARNAWRARTPGERQALLALFGVLIALVLWLVAIQPAWRTVRQAPAQLDQLDAQLQQFRAVAAEVGTLKATPPVAMAQAATALKSATDRLGERGRLSVMGDRATLTLTGVTPEALRSWLDDARTVARARPIDVQLVRAARGYNGSVTLSVGGNP